MTTQPKKGDTVNIQLHAQGLTNEYVVFQKDQPMKCIQNYNDYSLWSFQSTGQWNVGSINGNPVNITLEAVGDVLFNAKNNTFNIIATKNPVNMTVNSIEKHAQFINAIESFSLTFTGANKYGSFWSGNGISTYNQTSTNTKALRQNGPGSPNQIPIIAGHSYLNIWIQESKFDSYFGVPSSS